MTRRERNHSKRSSKRALTGSILAIVLCVVLLAGATFAWFTDTASTNVNKIEAGTLKIDFEMATEWDRDGNPTKWEDAKGKTLGFVVKQSDGSYTLGSDILWEPGCTYKLQELRVTSTGNLALKYKVVVTGIDGDAELNDAIDWTTSVGTATAKTADEFHLTAKNGTHDSDIVVIKGHMQETAGNTYQGMKIEEAAVTVYATQDTVEYDSTGNQYDADAVYLTVDMAASDITDANLAETFDKALAMGMDKLVLNVTNDGGEAKTVTVNNATIQKMKSLTVDLGEGVTFVVNNIEVKDGQTLHYVGKGTIKNALYPVCGGGTLIIENEGGIEQTTGMGNAVISMADYGANVVVRNCNLSRSSYGNVPVIIVGDSTATGYTEPSKITLENVVMENNPGQWNQSCGVYVFAGSLDITTSNVTFDGSDALSTVFGAKNKSTQNFLVVNDGATATLNGVAQTNG